MLQTTILKIDTIVKNFAILQHFSSFQKFATQNHPRKQIFYLKNHKYLLIFVV